VNVKSATQSFFPKSVEFRLSVEFTAPRTLNLDSHSNLGPGAASLWPAPEVSQRTRRGQHRALLIVRDEFRPALPRLGARQQSPSPLCQPDWRTCTPWRARQETPFLLCLDISLFLRDSTGVLV
jgi:hypothetical protein